MASKRTHFHEAAKKLANKDIVSYEEIVSTDLKYIPTEKDFEIKNLQEDPIIIDWLKHLKASTKKGYLRSLADYCQTYNQTHRQLLKEALLDDSKAIMTRVYVQKFLRYNEILTTVKYSVELSNEEIIERPYLKSSIRSRLYGIISFYANFGIDIPKASIKKITYTDENISNHNHKAPEKELIEHALSSNISLLKKSLILAQTSSGLSSIDLCSITVQQYENSKIKVPRLITDAEGKETRVYLEIAMLILKRQKTEDKNDEFVTFFSPEACQVIDKYLKWRNTPPSKLSHSDRKNAYEKRRYDIDIKNGMDPYLFCLSKMSVFDPKNRKEIDRKLNTDYVKRIYRSIRDASGLTIDEPLEWSEIRSHKMRKYFINNLENKTSNRKWVKFMAGHKTTDVEHAYYEPQQKELIDFYITECLPILQFRETEGIKLVGEDVKLLKELKESDKRKTEAINNLTSEIEVEKLRHSSEMNELSYGIDKRIDEAVNQKIEGLLKTISGIENRLEESKARVEKRNPHLEVNVPSTDKILKYYKDNNNLLDNVRELIEVNHKDDETDNIIPSEEELARSTILINTDWDEEEVDNNLSYDELMKMSNYVRTNGLIEEEMKSLKKELLERDTYEKDTSNSTEDED
jgi:integrase